MEKLDYRIFAISPDSPEKLRLSAEKKEAPYTLLSDSKMTVSKGFGIAWKVDDEMLEMLAKYNIDLEKSSGETHHLLPVPAVFIVGKKGTILFEYTNPNYRVRLDPDVLLSAARWAAR